MKSSKGIHNVSGYKFISICAWDLWNWQSKSLNRCCGKNSISFSCVKLAWYKVSKKEKKNWWASCFKKLTNLFSQQTPSRVKISDVKFSNIRGTSTGPVAVNLQCGAGYPCENINIQEINVNYGGGGGSASTFSHVKAIYSGKQVPAPCK